MDRWNAPLDYKLPAHPPSAGRAAASPIRRMVRHEVPNARATADTLYPSREALVSGVPLLGAQCEGLPGLPALRWPARRRRPSPRPVLRAPPAPSARPARPDRPLPAVRGARGARGARHALQTARPARGRVRAPARHPFRPRSTADHDPATHRARARRDRRGLAPPPARGRPVRRAQLHAGLGTDDPTSLRTKRPDQRCRRRRIAISPPSGASISQPAAGSGIGAGAAVRSNSAMKSSARIEWTAEVLCAPS